MQNSPEQTGGVIPVWTVERVEDTTAYQPGKGAIRVRKVTYRLFDGTESYVEVPLDGYSTEKVAATIDAHAQQLAATLTLRSNDIIATGG